MSIVFISDITYTWCAVGLNGLETPQRFDSAITVDLGSQPLQAQPADEAWWGA